MAVGGFAVDDDAAVSEVENPVVGDGGASVQAGFGGEVEPKCGIGDFDEPGDFGRRGSALGEVSGGVGDNGVGFGFARGIVGGRDVDRELAADLPAEQLHQDNSEVADGEGVRGILAHLGDQLPFDQLIALTFENSVF